MFGRGTFVPVPGFKGCVEALLVTARGDLRAYEDTHWLQLLESRFPCLGPQASSPPPQPAYFEPRDSLNVSHSVSFSTQLKQAVGFLVFCCFSPLFLITNTKEKVIRHRRKYRNSNSHKSHAQRQFRREGKHRT